MTVTSLKLHVFEQTSPCWERLYLSSPDYVLYMYAKDLKMHNFYLKMLSNIIVILAKEN
jgi:hypothetical protein